MDVHFFDIAEKIEERLTNEDLFEIEKHKIATTYSALYMVETYGRHDAYNIAQNIVFEQMSNLMGEVTMANLGKCKTQEDFDKIIDKALDLVDVHSCEFHALMGAIHLYGLLGSYGANYSVIKKKDKNV